jgi:hypothetical protein
MKTPWCIFHVMSIPLVILLQKVCSLLLAFYVTEAQDNICPLSAVLNRFVLVISFM